MVKAFGTLADGSLSESERNINRLPFPINPDVNESLV